MREDAVSGDGDGDGGEDWVLNFVETHHYKIAGPILVLQVLQLNNHIRCKHF